MWNNAGTKLSSEIEHEEKKTLPKQKDDVD